MSILKNARHEKFAQNVAKGMTATEAYEKAGYSEALSRFLRRVQSNCELCLNHP